MPVLKGTSIRIQASGAAPIAVEFAGPFSVEMSRGVEADEIKLLTSRPQEFEQLPATACTFVFRHAKGDLDNSEVSFSWTGWYMESLQPNPSRPGLYTAVFRDYRALAARKRINVAYNVQWPDEKFRKDSTGVFKRWKCVEAAWDCLELCGFTVDKDDSSLAAWQKSEILPSNLGNSKGGGFAGASFDEIIPKLLEQVRCDMVMTPEGKARVVSRGIYDRSAALKTFRLIGGVVGKRNVKWQKPKKIIVLFERMLEGGWDYFVENSLTASPVTSAMNTRIDNVMPLFSPDNASEASEWISIAGQLTAQLGITDSESWLCQKWFKPRLFPYRIDNDRLITESAPNIHLKAWLNDNTKRCWRRVFRVSPKTFTSESYTRLFTGIRLGRLDAQGGVKDGGGVFMDYTRHTAWGHPRAGGSSDPMALRFSENHFYGQQSYSSDGLSTYSWDSAPFDARWLSAEDLVFEVSPSSHNKNISTDSYYPATMTEALNYGEIVQLASSTALKLSELHGKFRRGWRLRVLWSARLSQDLPSQLGQSGQIGRLWEEERLGFGDGVALPIYVRVEEVTANHGYTQAQLQSSYRLDNIAPEVLLNRAEVEDVADHVVEQVKQTYEQNRAGVAIVAGVEPLTADIWTEGMIYKVRVAVGEEAQPDGVVTQYIVQPEVRPFKAKRRDLAGKPPKIAQDE